MALEFVRGGVAAQQQPDVGAGLATAAGHLGQVAQPQAGHAVEEGVAEAEALVAGDPAQRQRVLRHQLRLAAEGRVRRRRSARAAAPRPR